MTDGTCRHERRFFDTMRNHPSLHIPAAATLFVLCAMLSATPAEARRTHHASRAAATDNAASAPTAPSQSDAQSAPGLIRISIGGQQTLSAGRSLKRVAVGDPAVADVQVLKGDGGVLLVGKTAGSTDVMLWERGQSAPRTQKVEVTAQAASALLDGNTPTVKVLGKTAVIEGTTPTMETHQRAVAAAKASTGKDGVIVDNSMVASKSVVQVDVKVVEFSKSVLKEAGFNLFSQNNAGFAFGTFSPSSLQSAGPTATKTLAVSAVSPISSAFNLLLNSSSRGLFANLSLLESNNLARVLAQPTLVALSGQSANFLAGGEIPVPVPQSLGTTTIVYKPYGVGLTLTPTVLGPQRIALKVAPEASQLDFAHSITIDGVSVPAITTRRAETMVELGDGESFVIGGLVDRETASNINKVPFLGDLPVIGAFFKTLQYSQTDRELVIVVTPHLVAPIAKGAVLPGLPGEQAEQRDGPVWKSFVAGAAASDDAPGFSK